MEIYAVVPYTTNARTYASRPGHHVFINLLACIKDLEDMLASYARGYSTQWSPRGSSSAAHNAKTIFKKEVDEKQYAGRPWLHANPVNPDEPVLLYDVRNWTRLTVEDYRAWKVNALMMGKEIRWNFEDRWLPLLPSSDSPPPQRIVMEAPRRRR